MRYAKWTLMTIMFILAASVVWAQCPTATCPQPVQVQPVQVQCPQPCPVVQQTCPQVCPEPCPQTCPQPCPTACPCPSSVPAAIGAGPAATLEGLQCPDFDPAYTSSVYAQNSVILAVTEYGMQRTTDRNLRNISGEIHGYLASANNKLAGMYGTVGCGTVAPDCSRAQAIIAELAATPDDCFNAVYARTLSELLRQNSAANTLAASRSNTTAMRNQAQFLADKESDWVFRLDRWVNDHGTTM